jgi:rhodanese-related sulfurtransferase
MCVRVSARDVMKGGGTLMPFEIHREDVQRLMAESAQLVEVLPEKEYMEEHLPGAINLPLRKLDKGSAAQLDKERPLIVYCYDDA